jgi:hypothetical protein
VCISAVFINTLKQEQESDKALVQAIICLAQRDTEAKD